ncbi:hypothetical protein [Paenibacillus xylanexedens]|uniref:hypothetical protein n=1 Tax=Paenibacillus xylanexedens TaxID=528191 RepID=UPI000F51C69B|nr:hypothetical protein [Paenibacillus xylanexedens]RPK23990.1 hypothetical protein EDO6_04928 [Paenibacillus xylanexedens]
MTDRILKEPEYMTCLDCDSSWKVSTNTYYEHNNPFVGTKYYPLCKKCIKKYLNGDEHTKEKRVQTILQQLNRPWIHDQWEKNNCDWGRYMRHVSSLNNGHMTFIDSEFETLKQVDMPSDKSSTNDELVDKWGLGHQPDEYIAFEKKFDFLKRDYALRNSMHEEALKKYCRYAAKEEFAVVNNDFKGIEMWSKLANKAAEDAKINPKQFTKADLTDGIDSFGEMSRAVEKAVDVVEILPRFIQRANDKVDFTIWCYVNYERDLHGLPLVDYKEIYKFIEEREKAYDEEVGLIESSDTA